MMATTRRLIVDLPAEDLSREVVTRYWLGYDAYYTDSENCYGGHWSRCHDSRQAATAEHATQVAVALDQAAKLGQRRAQLADAEGA